MTSPRSGGEVQIAELSDAELRRQIQLLADKIPVPDVVLRRPRSRWWPSSRRTAPATTDSRPTPAPAVGRILVVEDDTATRRLLTEALGLEGFDVIAAQDGVHALRLAAASHPDIIVLDLGLPVLDGPSFVAKWQERAEAASVPIVVVSGRPDGRATANAIHAAGFCRKPLDLRALAKLIRSLLGRPPATFAGAA